jgi:hypothetical protein
MLLFIYSPEPKRFGQQGAIWEIFYFTADSQAITPFMTIAQCASYPALFRAYVGVAF